MNFSVSGLNKEGQSSSRNVRFFRLLANCTIARDYEFEKFENFL